MSDNTPGGFDPAAMWRMWSDFALKMMQPGSASSPPWPQPDAMRESRSAMLEAWARSWDEFLRSPPFLEMMRQSLTSSVEWRRQFNDLLGEMRHQFQGASRQDMDQLMLALRHLEQRLVDVAEGLAARLDDLSARLDTRENHGPSDAVETNGRPAATPLKGSHRGPGRTDKRRQSTPKE